MFINVAEELTTARKNGYAIGAFNTNNLEVTKAIAIAAKKSHKMVIIQTTPSAIEYAGLSQIFNIVKNEIDNLDIEAAIHLDHAKDFETVKKAIDIGYKSVMIDGSRLTFSENVALTKKVVEYAHPKNVAVEGEIGLLGNEGGTDNYEKILSSPEQTKQFVDLTGIDSVAISIGNQHGAPEGEKIDIELLKDIAKDVKIPLVLHGSSGLSREDIESAIGQGVAKINVDTLVRKAFIKGIKDSELDTHDYRDILQVCMENITEIVFEKIEQFNRN